MYIEKIKKLNIVKICHLNQLYSKKDKRRKKLWEKGANSCREKNNSNGNFFSIKC